MREAQKRGDLIGVRTSFVDDALQDPWALPPSQKRVERPIPGPFPPAVQIVRANLLYIEKNGLPPAMLNRLLRLAAFQNPEFYKAQAMRLPTFNKPRIIACGEDLANHIALPRGCLAEVMELFEAHHIKPEIRDERCTGHSIDAKFCGQLRPSQQDAVSIMAEQDEGILCSYCFRQDRSGRMADRGAKGEYPRTGSPPTVAGSVACQIGDVSQSSSQIDRPGWGRKERP